MAGMEMALSADSYVYLQAVSELLRIGPPVYFVVKSGLNFSDVNLFFNIF